MTKSPKTIKKNRSRAIYSKRWNEARRYHERNYDCRRNVANARGGTFLKAHWKVFAASDFFSVVVWTTGGLTTYYVLFVISLVDRVVHIAGITTCPDEAWMLQVVRNLLDEEDGAFAS